jgi:carbon-monoxide dehydrogenase medium subunit
MDIAVTNAAASVTFEGETVTSARVAIGAVAPTPLLVEDAAEALVGRPFHVDTVAAAAAASRAAARPIDDMRGSIKQRKHLAAVLTERVLNAAAERARGS